MQTDPFFKLMIFDLDGTLIHTSHELVSAVNDTLQGLGEKALNDQLIESWIGHGTVALLNSALSFALDKTQDEIIQWDNLLLARNLFNQNYLRRCGSNSKPYPNVHSVLKELKERGIRLALVTNKESLFTHPILKAHQLDALFEITVCGDTFATKKPNPYCIDHCLNQFDIQRSEALFVGDSSTDAKTARNADIKVLLMSYGYNMGEPIELSSPDYISNDFTDILRFAGPHN